MNAHSLLASAGKFMYKVPSTSKSYILGQAMNTQDKFIPYDFIDHRKQIWTAIRERWSSSSWFYTECQRKLISFFKEQNSLTFTASKLIKFGYRWYRWIHYIIFLMNRNWKIKGFPCLKNEKNAVNSQRVVFHKSQKLLTERAPQKTAYSEHYLLFIQSQW